MENNTQNNMVIEPSKKKSGLMMIIVIVIILALVALIYVRKMNTTAPQTQSDIELNQAVQSDTTASITESLGDIDLSNTVDEDLKSVDEELNTL